MSVVPQTSSCETASNILVNIWSIQTRLPFKLSAESTMARTVVKSFPRLCICVVLETMFPQFILIIVKLCVGKKWIFMLKEETTSGISYLMAIGPFVRFIKMLSTTIWNEIQTSEPLFDSIFCKIQINYWHC